MANNVVILIGRILLAAMFIMSGLGKFLDPAATTGMIAQAGFPAPAALNYLAGLFELVAGLAILIGLYTSIAAYALAAFCIFAGLVFHGGAIVVPGFPDGANAMLSMFNQLLMMKNFTIAGGFLVLAAFGPGAFSLDARRRA